MIRVVLTVLWFLTLAVTPPLMVWGWVRWAKRKQPRTAFATLSFLGFSLATLSALLAISSVIYGQAIGGFPFYDLRLLKIYRWGALISVTAIICAIGGGWRPGPVRWHAPACSTATLFFWVLAAGSE